MHASVSGPGRRRIADRIESWMGDSAALGPEGLGEGSTVAPIPNRLRPREASIERASHPNRFQSRWLILAYEKIVPTSTQRRPSFASPDRPIAEPTRSGNNTGEETS